MVEKNRVEPVSLVVELSCEDISDTCIRRFCEFQFRLRYILHTYRRRSCDILRWSAVMWGIVVVLALPEMFRGKYTGSPATVTHGSLSVAPPSPPYADSPPRSAAVQQSV